MSRRRPRSRGRKGRTKGRTAAHSELRAPRPASLSPAQLKKRASTLAAHAEMLRDPKLTASEAARDYGITTRDFWAYIPKASKKDSQGRIRAVPDRYVRRMEVPGPNGPIIIKIKGSHARNRLARYRNDVFRFQAGDVDAINKWHGVTIQGYQLLTDPRILQALGEEENLPEHFGSEQVIPYAGGAG